MCVRPKEIASRIDPLVLRITYRRAVARCQRRQDEQCAFETATECTKRVARTVGDSGPPCPSAKPQSRAQVWWLRLTRRRRSGSRPGACSLWRSRPDPTGFERRCRSVQRLRSPASQQSKGGRAACAREHLDLRLSARRRGLFTLSQVDLVADRSGAMSDPLALARRLIFSSGQRLDPRWDRCALTGAR